MTIPRDFKHVWTKNGATLEASISPCSFMYANYGFQLTIVMQKGGSTIVHRKSLSMEDATEAHAVEMCESVGVVPCTCCGKPAFDPATCHTNRERKCESCWTAEWQREFDELQKKEAAQILRRDKRMLKQGFTHRITAWIHPTSGDDRQVDIYSKGEPSKTEVQVMLKKQGSRILDDYQVLNLEDVTKKKG